MIRTEFTTRIISFESHKLPFMRNLLYIAIFLLTSTQAFAQSINREISVNGWTANGTEFVSVARSSGETEEGTYSYALLQVHDANMSTRLRHFRYGASQGPAQTAFQNAEGAPDGREYMLSSPPSAPASGEVSPNGRWFLNTQTRSFVRPAQTVECPTCRTCVTQYQVHLIDNVNEEVLVIDSGSREGNHIISPVEPHCVELSASGYWHDSAERFAIVLHEEISGNRFDTLSLFNFTGEVVGLSQLPLTRLERVLPRGELRATFENMVGSLATSSNRPAIMRELIFAAMNAGDFSSARDYLEISMTQNPEDNELIFTGHFLDFLDGNERAIRNVSRLVRRAEGALDHQMALLYYLNGDLDEANELIGQVSIEFALEVMRYDVTLGMRALENATLEGRNASIEIQRMLAQMWLENGRTNEATRIIQTLDQEDPANYILTLQALAAQGRADEAIRLANERLLTEPGNCELYSILGNAALEASDIETATEFFTAGRMCDPNLIESLHDLAVVAWTERRFDEASALGREYAQITGLRRNDPLQEQITNVSTYRSRLRSPDLILWNFTCSGTLYSGRSCTGTILNPNDSPTPSSMVQISAFDGDGDSLDALEISYGEISANSSFQFEATLMPFEDVEESEKASVYLNVTGPDTTSTTNRIEIGPGW